MPHIYTENPEETRVIVGSMNMGYGSDTARNRTHNLFRPKCAPIPGDSDGLLVPMRPRWWNRRHLTIGTDVIQPADVVRDLGIFFSSHLTMKLYEARVDRTCFYHLCRQQSIRHSLGLTSPHGLFPPSWSRGWITATRFWHIYRLQRWHRSRESSMLLLGCSWIWDHVITGHRCFTFCQLQRESSSNSASWYTMWSLVEHRHIWLNWSPLWPTSQLALLSVQQEGVIWSFSDQDWFRSSVFCCGAKSLERSAHRHYTDNQHQTV